MQNNFDKGIYEVYRVHATDSDIKWRRAGRFMISEGKLDILEDYFGLLEDLLEEGPVTEKTKARLESLTHSSYVHIVKDQPDTPKPLKADPSETPLVQWEDKSQKTKKIPVWDYLRSGMDRPHTIEHSNGQLALDGKALSEEEKLQILENLRTGVATLRYKNTLDKSEPLVKEEDMDPATALNHVRAAVKTGAVHPDVERALTRHIYEDKMMSGIGNRYAWNQFVAKKQPGVYIGLDSNSLKHLNDTHGHEAGDASITHLGRSVKEAIEESVGHEVAKAARVGGDEVSVFVPTHEHAAKFARALRQKLDVVPPIMGTHRMSVSMGFGTDPQSADKALYEAKKQKLHPKTGEKLHKPGQEPSMAHSLVPGHEGPIPLSEDR